MAERPQRYLFGNEGSYDHAVWEIEGGPHQSAALRDYVSLHESLHAELDRTTDFGALLSVLAFFVSVEDDAGAKRLLAQLTRSARTTHESYATSLAVLAFGSDAAETAALLSELGDYARYWEIGRAIAADARGRLPQHYAVASALRACMQAPVSEIVLRVGLRSLRFRDVPFAFHPDERLRVLRRAIAGKPAFWTGVLQRADGVDELAAAMHEAVAAELASAGMPTLPYGAHVANAAPLIADLERALGPALPRDFRLQAAPDLEPHLVRHLNFADERILHRREPLVAHLVDLGSMPSSAWSALISGSGENEHVYTVVRRRERLARQFALAGEDAGTSAGGAAVCCVQYVMDDGSIGLAEIATPELFAAFASVVSVRAPIVCGISLAVSRDAAWDEDWRSALAEHAECVMLFDVSPFQYVGEVSGAFPAPHRYGVVDFGAPCGSSVAVLLLMGTSEAAALFVVPCSRLVAQALHDYLQSLGEGGAASFVYDDGIDGGVIRLAGIVLDHISGEEWYTDFKAV